MRLPGLDAPLHLAHRSFKRHLAECDASTPQKKVTVICFRVPWHDVHAISMYCMQDIELQRSEVKYADTSNLDACSLRICCSMLRNPETI